MEPLRDLREKKKLTQADLAKMLGVSISTISRVEMKKRGVSKKLAQRWGDALNLSDKKRYELFFNQ